jgi:hypothetical protein
MKKQEMEAIAKKVALYMKQGNRDEVQSIDYNGITLTSKQKAFFDKGYWKGWKILGSFKTEKSWGDKSKEFEGLEMEKDGKVVKPLWVNGGSVLRVWD